LIHGLDQLPVQSWIRGRHARHLVVHARAEERAVVERLAACVGDHRTALDEAQDRGGVLNNTPYDLAAAVLCLTEGGAVVTDAHGERLDDRPLLGSGPEHQMACVAAANPALHAKLVEAVDEGVRRLTETPLAR